VGIRIGRNREGIPLNSLEIATGECTIRGDYLTSLRGRGFAMSVGPATSVLARR
jgi:hypothetical protein